jgi:predicted molibdopterin-dependent oxidoreductase YjgC
MKVKKPKNVDIGPRIRLDDERCIMCSRCIRFMDEVADDPVLGFTQRGSHTTLTVHPGRLLDSNNYSLNTVDICPVGALTSNDFRFQMRVWFLKETPTIDVNCGTGTTSPSGPAAKPSTASPRARTTRSTPTGCRIRTASISTTSTASPPHRAAALKDGEHGTFRECHPGPKRSPDRRGRSAALRPGRSP